MKEAGVRILYNTTFSKAVTDGKKVCGVVVENIEGRKAFTSKMVVD